MQLTAVTIQNHRLLALLVSQWQMIHGAFGPDQYIRLQQLWKMIPSDFSTEELSRLLCPIFATNDRQQDQFNNLIGKLAAELEMAEMPSANSNTDGANITNKPAAQSEPDIQLSESPTKPHGSDYRPLVVQLDECIDPPFTWNIASNDSNIEIDTGQGFRQTTVKMRLRELAEHTALDMPATIQATIRQSGMPTFRFRQRTRPPEYLFLVERFSQNDHRAGLFDHLFQTLRANEVFIERFFYDGDLRICRNERYSAGLNLHQLRYRFPNARLLVLGSGYRFISSRTGLLADWTKPLRAWPTRVLLTPSPHELWSRRENLLAEIFTLLPASIESLQYLAESRGGNSIHYEFLPDYIRHLAEVQPIILEEPLIRSLRKHFDAGMLCWIAACAIYPALHLALTLRLGRLISKTLGYNLVNAENLLALSRLSWFTNGKIPLEARDELVEYFEHRYPERHRQVLECLLELLEKNPPPENSVAWAEHQINLALLKVKTNVEPDEEMIRQLIPVVQRLNRPQRRGDFILPIQWEEYLKKIGAEEIDSEYQDDIDLRNIIENDDDEAESPELHSIPALENDDFNWNFNRRNGDQPDLTDETFHGKPELIRAWESIVDSFKNGTMIRGSVRSKTNGGFIVDCNGLKTFLPDWEIDIKSVIDYDKYVGKVMEFIVVKINENTKRAIVSHQVPKNRLQRRLKQDEAAWKTILAEANASDNLEDKIAAFEAYLDMETHGKFTDEAEAFILKLREEQYRLRFESKKRLLADEEKRHLAASSPNLPEYCFYKTKKDGQWLVRFRGEDILKGSVKNKIGMEAIRYLLGKSKVDALSLGRYLEQIEVIVKPKNQDDGDLPDAEKEQLLKSLLKNNRAEDQSIEESGDFRQQYEHWLVRFKILNTLMDYPGRKKFMKEWGLAKDKVDTLDALLAPQPRTPYENFKFKPLQRGRIYKNYQDRIYKAIKRALEEEIKPETKLGQHLQTYLVLNSEHPSKLPSFQYLNELMVSWKLDDPNEI